jgi:hypothetical protein
MSVPCPITDMVLSLARNRTLTGTFTFARTNRLAHGMVPVVDVNGFSTAYLSFLVATATAE